MKQKPSSSEKAERLCKKARTIAQKPENYGKAYELLLEAHNLGSGEAAYAIANWYFYGRFLPRDIDKAHEFWVIAASRDYIDGLISLAIYYESEEFAPQDMSKAIGYYMKAALLGDALSTYEVARIYHFGIGMKPDQFLADLWADMAEARGYIEPDSRQNEEESPG